MTNRPTSGARSTIQIPHYVHYLGSRDIGVGQSLSTLLALGHYRPCPFSHPLPAKHRLSFTYTTRPNMPCTVSLALPYTTYATEITHTPNRLLICHASNRLPKFHILNHIFHIQTSLLPLEAHVSFSGVALHFSQV